MRLGSDRVWRVAKHVDERVDETKREPNVAELGVIIGSSTTAAAHSRNTAEQAIELEVGHGFELAPEHHARRQWGNECMAGGQRDGMIAAPHEAGSWGLAIRRRIGHIGRELQYARSGRNRSDRGTRDEVRETLKSDAREWKAPRKKRPLLR